MFGAGDLVAGAARGLVPRAANAIFAGIRESDADEVTIKVVRRSLRVCRRLLLMRSCAPDVCVLAVPFISNVFVQIWSALYHFDSLSAL